jgi:hypothetical protein
MGEKESLGMLKPLKPIKITRSQEKLSNRIGLPLIEEIIDKLHLRSEIDRVFPKPGSNRGIWASDYVMTLMYMFIDGALHLEDVSHLREDKAYQEMIHQMKLPSSDAIGDWLRRYGSKESEGWMWHVMKPVLSAAVKNDRKDIKAFTAKEIIADEGNATAAAATTGEEASSLDYSEALGGHTLDVDATVIQSEKGDALKTYKGIKGYQPLLGIISESGIVTGSDFRQGNVAAQTGLVEFIEQCLEAYPGIIKAVRSDSASWQKEIVDYLESRLLFFTITADQTAPILEVIGQIPDAMWKEGLDRDGIAGGYDLSEAEYNFGTKKRRVRIVIKRYEEKEQLDLFTGKFSYWIVATNLPGDKFSAQSVIHFHEMRGGMEKRIGELKHDMSLGHLPCGQFNSNCLYFTIGILAYNMLQLLKIMGLPKDYRNRSVKSLRYQLLKLAGKLISHGRYLVLQVSAPLKNVELFINCYLRLHMSPFALSP